MGERTRAGLLIAAGVAALGTALAGLTLGCGPAVPADVKVITHGEKVELAEHTVAGKYTVFDFYAPWCPPCRVLGPALERLAARRPESLAVRKIDIVDWTMPVAAQHRIESLPYLILYDQGGRRMAEGEDVFDALVRIYGSAAQDLSEATREEPEKAPAAAGDPHNAAARPNTRTGS
jgi:thiol-disulfide isomerase/thioredoxin